ncbi:hypothetical protein ACWD1Z_06610 [Streptomyces sp. NPDC002784]
MVMVIRGLPGVTKVRADLLVSVTRGPVGRRRALGMRGMRVRSAVIGRETRPSAPANSAEYPAPPAD